MKLTMPEGLGVLGAVLVGVLLALGTNASAPEPPRESDDTIRQALCRAVDEVGSTPLDPQERDSRMKTLFMIAQAQFKLGDRGAARLEPAHRIARAPGLHHHHGLGQHGRGHG